MQSARRITDTAPALMRGQITVENDFDFLYEGLGFSAREPQIWGVEIPHKNVKTLPFLFAQGVGEARSCCNVIPRYHEKDLILMMRIEHPKCEVTYQ